MSIITGSYGQDVCFFVSFTNSCLEDKVALAQSKGYFIQFKYSKGSRYKTCKQFCSWLFWLHFKVTPLMSPFHEGKGRPTEAAGLSSALGVESGLQWIWKGKCNVFAYRSGVKRVLDYGSWSPKTVTINCFLLVCIWCFSHQMWDLIPRPWIWADLSNSF